MKLCKVIRRQFYIENMRKNFQYSLILISCTLIGLQIYLTLFFSKNKTESIRSFYADNVENPAAQQQNNVLNLAENSMADAMAMSELSDESNGAAQQQSLLSEEHAPAAALIPHPVDLSKNPLLATAERMRVPPEMPTELVGLVKGDIHRLQLEANKKAIGGHKRRFPDFIVIGMQKCGTTALQYFLNYHPQLKSPSEGELHYFEREGNYQKGYEHYLNEMPFVSDEQFVFEKTPDYMHDPRVPARMKDFNPDMKIIAVICDPVHRAFSHYLHATNIQRPDGWEMPGAQAIQEKSFEEVVYQALKESINSTLAQWLVTYPEEKVPYALIRDKWHNYMDINMKNGRRYLMPSSILARSSYGYLLGHWYRYFPRKQFLVIDGNEIKVSPASALRKVQDFIGADHHLTDDNFMKQEDTGLYCIRRTRDSEQCTMPGGSKGRTAKTAMSAPVEQVLRRFFRAIEADNAEVMANMYPLSWSEELMTTIP